MSDFNYISNIVNEPITPLVRGLNEKLKNENKNSIVNTHFNSNRTPQRCTISPRFVFYQCNIEKIDFHKITFSQPINRTKIIDCGFTSCKIKDDYISLTEFTSTVFKGGSFFNTTTNLTTFNGCSFDEVTIERSDFAFCSFVKNSFKKVNFVKCDFIGSRIIAPIDADVTFNDCSFENTKIEASKEVSNGFSFINCRGI